MQGRPTYRNVLFSYLFWNVENEPIATLNAVTRTQQLIVIKLNAYQRNQVLQPSGGDSTS